MLRLPPPLLFPPELFLAPKRAPHHLVAGPTSTVFASFFNKSNVSNRSHSIQLSYHFSLTIPPCLLFLPFFIKRRTPPGVETAAAHNRHDVAALASAAQPIVEWTKNSYNTPTSPQYTYTHTTMLRLFRQSTNATRAFSTARCLAQVKKGDVATTSGFEDGNGGEIVSGAPHDLTQRVVRIYQQSPSAYQSGTHGTKSWRIDWDVVPRANRWENDLMGWASSGDYM